MRQIIDISHHKGNVDFEKVKAAGISGVILRSGFGMGNLDNYFEKNIKKAIEAGLSVGIYYFSYAYTENMAKNEAKYCLKFIGGRKLQLPVFFDWEYASEEWAKKHGKKVTGSLVRKMTLAFMEEIESAGYTAGFYYNNDYMERGLYNLEDYDEKYVRWYARYNTKAKYKGCDIWQYSEKGKVDGIKGNTTDMDYLVTDTIMKFAGDLPEVEKGKWYKEGDKGPEVEEIQWFLKWKGLYKGELDQDYGPKTKQAVCDFQESEKIKKVNGCWGVNCRKAAEKYM